MSHLRRLPLLLLLAVPTGADAQEALDELRTLVEENAEAWAGPLTRGLGQALADGYADRSRPLSRFGVDVGVRVFGTRIVEDDGTFRAVLPDSLVHEGHTYSRPFRSRDGSLESPTIVGAGPGLELELTPEFEEELRSRGVDPSEVSVPRFPDGLDLPAVPLAMLHASVGIGFGTDLSGHFVPPVTITPEVGEIGAKGITARHALTRWLPPSPFDVSVSAGYHGATAGEYLEVEAWHYGLLAGVGAGPVTFFGGPQLRNATTRVTYGLEVPHSDQPDVEVSFETESRTGPSWMVGARLQLLVINVSGHYAFGPRDVFSLKLGMGMP